MSFNDLENALDNADESSTDDATSTDTDDQYDAVPRVKLTPEASIGGTIVDVGFTGDLYDKQNIRGDGYGGDFVFRLENPTVPTGTVFEATGRTDAPNNLAKNMTGDEFSFNARTPTRDFRVVPDDWNESPNVDEAVRKVDGEYTPVGIEVYGSEFVGEPVDDIDDALTEYDAVEVFLGGQAGRLMMQSLDAALSTSAYFDGSDKTAGLIEFPSEYATDDWSPKDGEFPRAARQPVLHPELDGEKVLLKLHFGDQDPSGDGYMKHYGDVVWDNGDGGTVLTPKGGTHPLTEDTSVVNEKSLWMEFHEPDGGWTNTDTDDDDDGSDALNDYASDTSNSTSTSTSSNDGDGNDGDGDDFSVLDESTATEPDGGAALPDFDDRTNAFIDKVVEQAVNVGSLDDAFRRDVTDIISQSMDAGEIGEYDVTDVEAAIHDRIDAAQEA